MKNYIAKKKFQIKILIINIHFIFFNFLTFILILKNKNFQFKKMLGKFILFFI